MQKNIRLIIVGFINAQFKNKLDKITDLQFANLMKTFRYINEVHSKIIITKSDICTIEVVYKLIDNYYNEIAKKNCEL